MQNAMKIAVLGTGSVGQTIASKLVDLGHSVVVGTRDPAATMARVGPDRFGNPSFSEWRTKNPKVGLGTLAEAASQGELVVNATTGMGSLEALKAAGEANLAGKVLLDISNPLDFSRGMPPTLAVCNTDSLGELIQRSFPKARVVKSLNTMTAALMTAPRKLSDGAHSVFVSGNDAAAKETIGQLLRSFGWQDIVDLGDITTARGAEMYVALWVRLWSATGNPVFSIQVVR